MDRSFDLVDVNPKDGSLQYQELSMAFAYIDTNSNTVLSFEIEEPCKIRKHEKLKTLSSNIVSLLTDFNCFFF